MSDDHSHALIDNYTLKTKNETKRNLPTATPIPVGKAGLEVYVHSLRGEVSLLVCITADRTILYGLTTCDGTRAQPPISGVSAFTLHDVSRYTVRGNMDH